MRGYFGSDFFGGHFGPKFGGMSGSFDCPFRGGFLSHHGPRTFGPFGPKFDHSPERHEHHHHGPDHRRGPPEDSHRGPRCGHHESDSDSDGAGERHCHGGREHHNHGPEHQRCGPPKDGHRGPRCGHHGSDSDSDGARERHRHGPSGFRGCGGRHHDFHGHGPSCHSSGPRFGRNPERPCFGRRGPSDFPWGGPWGGDRHLRGFGHHGPFGHRRPCPYDSEERPSRKADCEKCRENQPCCLGNKEKRGRGKGRKENGPCCDKDKNQNLGDTVFVQRIVLEKATRPQSV